MSQAPSQPSLRFVHASDFHLECPLGGVAEVPENLRELFLEAPFLAALQVFETVLAEGADALLLSGDVVDFDRVGPRAIVFLTEQFQRLNQHGVAVYWACGDADPSDSWPASVELPENVHIFPVGRVESIPHQRGDETVALIQGISRQHAMAFDDEGFHRDVNGLFTVGISYGTAASPGAEGDRVHYMALGGQHRRQTVDQSPGIAHYAGTPQGRTPEESGPRGCTLVTVDEAGNVKTRFVATDQIRWVTEMVEITAGTDHEALYQQLLDRIAKLRDKHQERNLLVTWQITGHGTLLYHIRRGGVSDSITQQLRDRHGAESPAVWTVAIECDAPLEVPAEWYDQETIRGDLLRHFQQLEADDEIRLGLTDFLPEDSRDGPMAELAEVNADDRPALLLAASKLGIDLMDGDDL
ncbi:MAG: DNA repair exonuclease [Planctomycetes bacterium]|nr:DNA repair exonuclease [Planctomycetota bacterium]